MNIFASKPNRLFSQKMRRVALVAAVLLCGMRAWAADYTWTGASITDSHDWNDADNWSGGVVPTASDNVIFTGEDAVTVNIADDVSITDLKTHTSGGNTITFNISEDKTLSAANYHIHDATNFSLSASSTETCITGKGTFSAANIDIPNNATGSSPSCDFKISVDSESTFKVTYEFYADTTMENTQVSISGNGNLSLPSGGFYSGSIVIVDDAISVDLDGTPVPVFSLSSSADGKTINITLDAAASSDMNCRYTATATGANVSDFTVDGSAISSNGNLTIPYGESSKDFTLGVGTTPLDDGDKITLTVYSPYGTLLGSVIYTYIAPIYYWIGGSSTTWNDGSNWSDTDGGSAIGSYPQSGDTAVFTGSDSYSFTDPISVGKIDNSATLEFRGEITVRDYTGSGSIVNKGKFIINSKKEITIQTMVAGGDCEVRNDSSSNLVIKELSGTNKIKIKKIYSGLLTVEQFDGGPAIECEGSNIHLGTGTVSSINITSGEIVLDKPLTVTGDVSITGSGSYLRNDGSGAGELTVNGDVNISADGHLGRSGALDRPLKSLTVKGNITNSGEIAVKDSLTLGGNFINSGTFHGGDAAFIVTGENVNINCGSGIKAKSFTYAPVDSSGNQVATGNITLIGANEFQNFTVDGIGGSLTVNGAQTVTGTFLLSGKSAANKLAVTGSGGSFVISGDQTAQLLSIYREHIGVTGGVVTAEFSEDSNGNSNEELNGWKIPTSGIVTWTGVVDEKWEDADNWEPKIVPGESGNDYEVLIPPEYPAGTAIANFPKTAAAYTITKPVTIARDASLEIGSTVTFSEIVNNGELIISADFTMPATYSGGGEIKITDQALLDATSGAFTIAKLTIGDNTVTDSMAATGVPSIKLGASNITVSGDLANYGKIIFTGAGRINKNDVDSSHKGTVQYSGGSNFTDFGATDYYNLIVDSGVSVKGTTDCVIDGNFKLDGEVELYEALTLTPKKITVNIETIIAAGGRFSSTGDQTYNGNVTNNGTLDLGAVLTNYADVTFGADFINNGTFNETNSTLTATGVDAKIGGSSPFTIKEFKYIPTTPASAKLAIDGANTITTFVSESVGIESITLNGANTFKEFTVKNAATLTVNAAQTVTGTTDGSLVLSGTSTTPLTIDGSGSFALSADQTNGEYLLVKRGGVSITPNDKYFYATNSSFDSSTESEKYGVHKNWVILNDNMVFTWTGTSSDTWATAGNWDIGLVPGLDKNAIAAGNPPVDTRGYNVVIPKVASNKYPTAAAEYTIGNLTIGDSSITDSPNTSADSMTTNVALTLSTANDIILAPKTGDATLINYGKIIYSAAGRIGTGVDDDNDPATPLVFVSKNDTEHNGTVEYNGGTTITDFGETDYFNLIVDSGVTLTGNTNIVVDGDAKIEGEISQITLFKVKGKTTIGTTGKIFTFGDQEYTGDVTNSGEILLGALSGTQGNITFGGNFTHNGTFTGIAAKVTVTGTDVTISGTKEIKAKEFVYTPLDSTGVSAPNGAKLKIENANTWGDTTTSPATGGFTASNLGGATITLDGAQTITGTLTLSGKNAGTNIEYLTIDGTGSFVLSETQKNGEYLKIKREASSITKSGSDEVYYIATNSEFSSTNPADLKYGEHNNWIILHDNMEFIWIGGASGNETAWNEGKNWNIGFVPGLSEDDANGRPMDTRGYNVVIPEVTSNKYPAADAEYTIGNLTIGDTSMVDPSNTSASMTTDVALTLSSANNIILKKRDGTTGALANYGKIKYSAAGRITDDATPTPNPLNDTANNGTVEYSGGATTLTDFASGTGADYYNLIVKTDAAIAGATTDDIVIENKAVIKGELSTANSIAINGDAEISGTISSVGTLTVTKTTVFDNASVATTGNQTYTGTVTVQNNDTTLTATSVTFKDDVTNSTTFTAAPSSTSTEVAITIEKNYTNDSTNGTFSGANAAIKATSTNATIAGGAGITAASFEYAPTGNSGNLTFSGKNQFTKRFTIVGARDITNNTVSGVSGTFTIDTGCTISLFDDSITGNITRADLELIGTESSPLIIDGEGEFILSETQALGKNLSIVREKSFVKPKNTGDEIYYVAYSSEFFGTPIYGHHKGWVILHDDMEFIWTGAVDTAWEKPGNWNYELVPGKDFMQIDSNGNPVHDASGTPKVSFSTKECMVAIPVKNSTGTPPPNYPVVKEPYTVRLIEIGKNLVSPSTNEITDSMTTNVSVTFVEDSTNSTTGSLTLTESTLNKLTNYGKIIYSAAGRITDDATPTPNPLNDTEHKGTVKYAGATTLTNFTDGVDYANLEIAANVASDNKDIIVALKTSFSGNVSAAANSITFKGDVAETGAVAITGDVYLSGDSNITVGSGSGSYTITGNLHIAPPAGTVKKTIASPLTATNIILYSGKLNANANISTDGTEKGDLIIFGAGYNVDDTHEGDADSDQTGLFTYHHTARDGTTHAAPSIDAFPATCPDTSAIPDGTTGKEYSAAVNVAAGKTITVGKNFYANGTAITGAGAWTLNLPNSDNQKDAFAELYNSSISNCTVTARSGQAFVAAAEDCTVTNCPVTETAGIYNSRPWIAKAYTVYDDVIYVEFKDSLTGAAIKIENSNNEIWTAVADKINNIHHWNGAAAPFAGAYIDADCTTTTDGKGDLSSFYIRTASKWNTNATGTSAGSDSTDRSGTQRNAIPCINLKKALAGVYETLRDNHKNRIAQYYTPSPNFASVSSSAGATFTDVADHCAPVIIAVYTGQEMHENNAAQQNDYDSHNFMEFLYSEEININESAIQVLKDGVNKQAIADLGATTPAAQGFAIAGFGTFTNGKLEVGLKPGSAGDSPNALYRKYGASAGDGPQENKRRIRLSVAGYVDGTVPSTSHKNWTGYISAAEMPTGNSFRHVASPYVKDVSANSADDGAGTANHTLALLTVNAQADKTNLHGAWDVTPPSFAPMRVNAKDSWTRPSTDASSSYEIIGISYTGGMLNAIELHMFDNEPTYADNEPLQWFSRVGWATPKPGPDSTEYESVVSKAADILGGSRPYPAMPTTGGGIRYCSVYNANNSFTYADSNDDYAAYHGFSQNIGQGAVSALFTDVAATGNDTDEEDGHYLKLFLDDTMLSSETNFILKFDSSTCYVTDLAGNRIQCGTISMRSVDRSPPSFLISAAPLGMDKLLIIFAKELNTDTILLYRSANDKTSVNALDYISRSIELTDESGTGIQVDSSVPAQVVFQSKRATGIAVKLKQNTVLKDITSGVRITIKSDANGYDPLSGTIGKITYIQDDWGNFIKDGRQHAFSDFAVNAVQMQFAYPIIDPSMEDVDKLELNQGNFVVRNWDAEQGRSGFITEEKEIILHAALYDGTEDNSGGLDTSEIPTAYFDSAPTPQAVSDVVNTLMQGKRTWRVWVPNVTSEIFDNLASQNNNPELHIDGELANSSKSTDRQFVNFDIPQDVSSSLWKSGDQVKFLFKLGDYTVVHNPDDGIAYPLYCLRLSDSADLASLDLWSFTMKNTVQQRGGVSIRNNVINVNEGQKTTLQVEVRSEGNLNVVVTSLDGSIVKYLHHGKAQKGTHYYTWDGTNNSGTPVARGLYFVRVFGAGIDETRKVMCVK